MLFCPKCGKIMVPKEEGKKRLLTCTCGYSSLEKEDILMTEDVKIHKKVEVIDDKASDTMPKTQTDCQKCGGKEAYYWSQQTRASDEAETQFYECVNKKCKHRWRAYG